MKKPRKHKSIVKHNLRLRIEHQASYVSSINAGMCIKHFSTKEAKLLEYFASFKLSYIDSIIYDYKPSKVVGRKKIYLKSVNTVIWAVNQFIERGWARMEGKNLVLASKKELKKLYKVNYKWSTVCTEFHQGETRYVFQTMAMKHAQKRKNWLKGLEEKSLIHKAETKKAKNVFSRYSGFFCDLSYGYLSRAFDVPTTTCKRAIKVLEKKAFLKAKRTKQECLGKMTFEAFSAIMDLGFYKLGYAITNMFFYKGYVFHVPNNQYLLFPVRKPSL
jgi:hypothetical protein